MSVSNSFDERGRSRSRNRDEKTTEPRRSLSIQRCLSGLTSRSENLTGQSMSEDDLIDVFEKRIFEIIKSKIVPGISIGIIESGKVILSQGYGKRNLKDDDVTPETIYQLGEISEILTVFYHASLITQTGGSFDDKISSKYSVCIASPIVNSHATYSDIYSHRMGYNEENIGLIKHLSNQENIEQSYNSVDLVSEEENFRSKYSYQPVLFEQACNIISREIQGQSISVSLPDFFKSIGMKRTGLGKEFYEECVNRADSIVDRGNGYESCFVYDNRSLSGSTGVCSNVTDLLNLIKMIFDFGSYRDRMIIDPLILEETFKPRIEIEEDIYSALGWNVSYNYSSKVYYRNSVLPTGQTCLIAISKEMKFGFVALSSSINPMPSVLLDYAWNLFVEKNVRLASHSMRESYDHYRMKLNEKAINPNFPMKLKKSLLTEPLNITFENDGAGNISLFYNETSSKQFAQIGTCDPVEAIPYMNNIWRIVWKDIHGIQQLTQFSINYDHAGNPTSLYVWILGKEKIYKIRNTGSEEIISYDYNNYGKDISFLSSMSDIIPEETLFEKREYSSEKSLSKSSKKKSKKSGKVKNERSISTRSLSDFPLEFEEDHKPKRIQKSKIVVILSTQQELSNKPSGKAVLSFDRINKKIKYSVSCINMSSNITHGEIYSQNGSEEISKRIVFLQEDSVWKSSGEWKNTETEPIPDIFIKQWDMDKCQIKICTVNHPNGEIFGKIKI